MADGHQGPWKLCALRMKLPTKDRDMAHEGGGVIVPSQQFFLNRNNTFHLQAIYRFTKYTIHQLFQTVMRMAFTPSLPVLACDEQVQAQLDDITEKLQNLEITGTENLVSFDFFAEPGDIFLDSAGPGFNTRLHEETRRGLAAVGLLPRGPPSEPTWIQFLSPEDASPASTPGNWKCIDFHIVSLDPFFAPIVGPWIREFPCLRDLKLPLPNSPNPHISFFPGLLLLPAEVLLHQTQSHTQTDWRLKAPEVVGTLHDHPLIAWYRQVWNLHCATRQYWLTSQGYQSDWNWASGFFPRATDGTLKETFGGNSLMEEHGAEVPVRYGQLLKGFAKMPRAMATWGMYLPKPEPRRFRNGSVHLYDEAHYS